MKLLVTGGAGYIGSVVATQLIEAGHDVVVLDNLDTGHAESVPATATFVQRSTTDAEDVLADGIEAVLHFAAKSLVGQSMKQPELYWHTNVIGTLSLLDAMRRTGVGRIVFSSTAATYGVPAETPITETMPAAPINPYGMTKLAVDNMLAGEATAHGLAAVSLRYFNVGGAYGGRGERHHPETHLIPNVLEVAAGDRSHVAIFGTDYPTKDGTAIRDYLHVEDLGRAHLLALDEAAAGEHLICNLGTGTGYTVREVIEACRAVTGHAIPAVEQSRRTGDPPVLVASWRRAAERLGWTAEHGLERIVADAWAFMAAQ